MLDTFDFGSQYQLKLISLCIRDENFLKKYSSLIRTVYFENIMDVTMYLVIAKYFEEYKKSPTFDTLFELIREYEGAKFSEEKQEAYAVRIDMMQDADISDKQYLEDRIQEFVRYQAMKIGILESAEMLQRREHNYLQKVYATIDKASKISAGFEEMGLDYFKTLEIRLTGVDHQYREVKIATLLRSLDVLTNGGLGNGELGIVMASTSMGKSMVLTFFGKSCIFLGKKIVHYSLEMSDLKIAERYDKCFTGMDRATIHDRTTEAIQTITGIGQRFGGNLIIKKYPSGTASVMTIKNHLAMLSSNGFVPDLVIVDYGDIMRPTKGHKDDYAAQGEIFESLRGIAGEMNVPIWTATQAQRQATNKRTVTLDDVADSFEKVRIADVVITLCQTDEEKRNSKMRFFIAKNRDNVAHQTINVRSDWARVQITEVEQSQQTESVTSGQVQQSRESMD